MFYDSFDPDAIKVITRNAAGTINEDDPLTNRLGSGLSRLMLISFATIEFLQTFPFPATSKVLSLTIGSNIITSGLRGGFLGLLLSVILFYKLLSVISQRLKENKSRRPLSIFGFSLMYSLVFQAMVYNDYGFSTYYGLVMYACIFVLSDKKLVVDNAPNSNGRYRDRRFFFRNMNAQST